MATDMLSRIKTYLRIKHNALDEDIEADIQACFADLEVCGVVFAETGDPLIYNAVKLWCRASYTDDTAKAARYREGYDRLKAFLQMAGPYQCTEEAAADE